MGVSESHTLRDINLSGWIIEDGNFADFSRGQVANYILHCMLLEPMPRLPGG